jgi:hypothetical protein
MFQAGLMTNIFLLKINTDTKEMLSNLWLIKNFIKPVAVFPGRQGRQCLP